MYAVINMVNVCFVYSLCSKKMPYMLCHCGYFLNVQLIMWAFCFAKNEICIARVQRNYMYVKKCATSEVRGYMPLYVLLHVHKRYILTNLDVK